jgi:hypothetical protein
MKGQTQGAYECKPYKPNYQPRYEPKPEQLYTLDYQQRIAMWHEAGHAIAAMHFGRKIHSYGIAPIPHCLINSLFLSKRQKGILLCAGAAMTKEIFGFEWGGDCTDWKMAEAIGDLEEFKAEAEKLCKQHRSEAKYLTEKRLGPSARIVGDPEDSIPDLTEDSPHYAECARAAEKAILPDWASNMLLRMAHFQIKRPAFTAKWLGI